jgi:quercetin dioxygenase-like cupin family protein
MNTRNHKPTVLQPGEGRKIMVLGMEVTKKLSSLETGGDYFLFDGVVRQGDRVPPHIHHREDEIIQVLEGELEIFLGGMTFKAPAGAVAYFPRNVVHAFANVGNAPAKARFLASPGENFEKFFEELSALPANQPPDMAKVMEIFVRYGLPIVPESAS